MTGNLKIEYFFSKPDPDYRIKGSRDPLGFQTIWKQTAQELVAYLSTVSTNLRDFQTFCLAYYFQSRNEPHILSIIDVNWFLRFEQLCAYTRYHLDYAASFNGKDRVAKRYVDFKNRNKFLIHHQEQAILSNQIAYGIWGKYNRPFHDMGFLDSSEFKEIFDEKLELTKKKNEIIKIIQKIDTNTENVFSVNITELETIGRLFTTVSPREKMFYEENILKIRKNHLQNELYEILKENPGIIEQNNVYTILSFLNDKAKTVDFRSKVKEIEDTEHLLCPLNRIFRYLQCEPYGWNKEAIQADDFINKLNKSVEKQYTVMTEVKINLNHIFSEDNWDMVGKLINRNKEVCGNRNSLPWLEIEGDNVRINSNEGHFRSDNYSDDTFDNMYLLNTYMNLFKEINSL